MGKKLYIGGLPYSTTQEALASLFSEVGTVESARIITDRETGRSKGFAFIEMADANADSAIQNLNGFSFLGREITVNEARPQTERNFNGGGYQQSNRNNNEPRSRGYNAR
jgi:RNA recognition motif-containing protein